MTAELTTTTAGDLIARLDEEHRNARGRLQHIANRREGLALAGAMGDDKAVEELRQIGEDETRLLSSVRNIEAALKAANAKHAEAQERERVAAIDERWDRADMLLKRIGGRGPRITELIGELAVELKARHDDGVELQGLRVADEQVDAYVMSGAGIVSEMVACGLGGVIKDLPRSDQTPLRDRDAATLRLPSRDVFRRTQAR